MLELGLSDNPHRTAHPEVPDGLTPEARRAREDFYRDYERFLKSVRKIALKVLIWGPALTLASPLTNKRLEIRNALRKRGHFAAFSEEITVGQADIPLNLDEYAQASAADFIIVLAGETLGATGELHDIGSDPKLVQKTFAMFPRSQENGYAGLGIVRQLQGRGAVHWYEESELTQCNVLTQAIERTEMLRFERALFRARRRRR